ncbi:MAG: heme-copper oxidase subunit III, partial [Cyanobacteria bacterium MAG APA_bin_95]|nr:heme-copper oxidase subunit III [Cyanobacteria bacterium MAG APA_bin_95]
MTTLIQRPTSHRLEQQQEDRQKVPVHSHHPDVRLFGLTVFLVADGMTFAGFFAAYLTYRAVNPLPVNAEYELELLLPAVNTLLLLASSLTFHRGSKALMAGSMSTCRSWLLLTA